MCSKVTNFSLLMRILDNWMMLFHSISHADSGFLQYTVIYLPAISSTASISHGNDLLGNPCKSVNLISWKLTECVAFVFYIMQVKHEQKGAAHTHTPKHTHIRTGLHAYMVIIYQIFLLCCSYSFRTSSSHISFPFRICVWVLLLVVCECVCVSVLVHVSSLILIAAFAFDMQNCAQFIINGVRILYPWSGIFHFLLLLLLLLLLYFVVLHAAARWRNCNIIFRNLERKHNKMHLAIVFGIRSALLNFN